MYTHDIELKPGYGHRLATARKSRKLTQAAVGELLGCRDTTIWKWEKEHSRPRDTDLIALQQATGIRKAWVAFGEEPMETDLLEVAGFIGEAIQKITRSQRIYDLEGAPKGSFMSPVIEGSDLLLMAKPAPIQEGQVYLVNTVEGTRRVGRVFRHVGWDGWVLYSDEDRTRPGTCLPIQVRESDLVGWVVAVVRPLG
ncbi:MAG: helix-turn-helix domain-containing protein [Acidobacteria bacterium]|nr:helix-turn-helix domain-containing protein [Acidobacteriota bacterium]